MSYPQARAGVCSTCNTALSPAAKGGQSSCSRCHRPFLSTPTRPPPLSASPPLSPLPSEMSTTSSSALSPAEVDRHLEARLQSLTSRPVSVYLPTPSTTQLQSRLHRLLGPDAPPGESPDVQSLEERLHRLSRGEAAASSSPSHAELEQRLRRLQGDSGDGDPAAERKEGDSSLPTSSHPASSFSPPPLHEDEDVEAMLKQLNEEAKLDLATLAKVGQRLSEPFNSSTRSARSTSRATVVSPPLDVDDPLKLMEHLQSLPSTEVLRLKEAVGEGGGEGAEAEEEERREADNIVRQALDEARLH